MNRNKRLRSQFNLIVADVATCKITDICFLISFYILMNYFQGCIIFLMTAILKFSKFQVNKKVFIIVTHFFR